MWGCTKTYRTYIAIFGKMTEHHLTSYFWDHCGPRVLTHTHILLGTLPRIWWRKEGRYAKPLHLGNPACLPKESTMACWKIPNLYMEFSQHSRVPAVLDAASWRSVWPNELHFQWKNMTTCSILANTYPPLIKHGNGKSIIYK